MAPDIDFIQEDEKLTNNVLHSSNLIQYFLFIISTNI